MTRHYNEIYNGWIIDVRLTGGVREGYETHTALKSAEMFCGSIARGQGRGTDDPMVRLGAKYLSAFVVSKAAQETGNIDELFGLDLRMSAVFGLECRNCVGTIHDILQEASECNDRVLERALKSVGVSSRFAI